MCVLETLKHIAENAINDRVMHLRPLELGWSDDQKYTLDTVSSGRFLLRIADIESFDRKLLEHRVMNEARALGIKTQESIACGSLDEHRVVYHVVRWCDGALAERALSTFSRTEQHALGAQAGRMLRLIHSIEIDDDKAADEERHHARALKKLAIRINKYTACGIRFPGDDVLINHLEANASLLKARPSRTRHGDYHVGNMLIDDFGGLWIIDWNRSDRGDPWEEFDRLVWSVAKSPAFATGQIDGYFGEKPPPAFFDSLMFYMASNALSSVCWAIAFGKSQVDIMLEQNARLFDWFENFSDPVPGWYTHEKAMHDRRV